MAIDLGTSHVKAALIGADGTMAAEAHTPLSTTRGPDGLMHQQVEDWGRAVRDVIEQCLAATAGMAPCSSDDDAVLAAPSSSPPQLAAIAVTGQMQDLILLGEDSRPTHPVVLYSDTHAAAEHAALTVTNPTWLPQVAVTPPPGPDSLPPKILHVTRHVPDAMAASATALFSAAGWVAHALTNVRVCDRLTASTTGFFDPRTDDWIPLRSPEGTALVPAHLRLPRLVDPGVVGHVTAQAARTFDVPAGTPVVMALGDAGSATDGMVGSVPGSAYLHLGTTGWVAFIDPTLASDLPLPAETGEHPQHHRLVHPAGHLAIARLPAAGEALEHARRDLLELTDPHSPDAHAYAEAALTRADAAGLAYAEVVSHVADDVAALLDRLGARPSRLPATGGVVRSPMVRQILEQAVGVPVDLLSDAEAGLVSCARVAFDALGVEHAIAPLDGR
nr:FGGY family carbohydrate kinase [Brevibacterium yomogidense]